MFAITPFTRLIVGTTIQLKGAIVPLVVSAISLIGASAMAGVVGGGGLGDLAIRYGYQRYEGDVIIVTLAVLIIMVMGMQSMGNSIAKKLKK